jgi:hypothetical protein
MKVMITCAMKVLDGMCQTLSNARSSALPMYVTSGRSLFFAPDRPERLNNNAETLG